jgi:hypothetical protein
MRVTKKNVKFLTIYSKLIQVNRKLISGETKNKFKVTLKTIWSNTKFNLVLLSLSQACLFVKKTDNS